MARSVTIRGFLAILIGALVGMPVPAGAATTSSVLHGLAAVSSTDAWATGYSISGTGVAQTLAEHWDGTTWSIVSTPSPGTGSDFLNQAVALASNDVWVVGSRDNKNAEEGAGSRTLIEHWDGSSWQVVPSPNAGDVQNILRGIAAVSPTDVWAGGYSKSQGSPRRTLIEHWDGTSWQVVPSPNASSENNGIMQLAAVTANDVWAVGNFNEGGTPHTLTEHWDGTSWEIVASPSPGVGGAFPQGTLLWSVAALAGNDVWAVGQYYDGSVVRSLSEHWDGTSWSIVPGPATAGESQLRGVVALATNDAWAVGWAHDGVAYRTLTEHWDGASWSVVASPNGGTGDNFLKPIAAVSADDIWTGGYLISAGVYQPLIERWDGSSWTVVPSANGDSTPTTPGAPTLSATGGNGVVHLSWTAPPDGGSPITNYMIYRGTSSGAGTLLTTVGNVASYDDTAVSDATAYFYQVSAVNAVGEGQRSNEASAVPQLSGVPGAPVLAASGASGKGILLSWTAPSTNGSPITGYRIYRGTTSGNEAFLASVGSVTSYKNTSTKRGVTYYYVVTAVNAAGEGPPSNEASAVAT